MNDISLHSTSYTAQNVILDLACADPSVIPILREESARVLKEAGGEWTRQAVAKLKLVDSTIHESLRLTPFNSVGLPRTQTDRIIQPHGITVEQDKSVTNIPFGSKVMIPVEAIHYDESVYPDAKNFKPFRFADANAIRNVLDSFGAASSEDTAAQQPQQTKQKAASLSTKHSSASALACTPVRGDFSRLTRSRYSSRLWC
ncbi:cytochrome P450 [Xylaria cubensis]|nr:cytochrome P450 [Xylaria cubensis]